MEYSLDFKNLVHVFNQNQTKLLEFELNYIVVSIGLNVECTCSI